MSPVRYCTLLRSKGKDTGNVGLFICLFVCWNRSATLDSNLFSSYFGNCPVISAKGRTFPVTTFFLENIYEQLDYRLASDSPAAFLNSSKGHSRKVCSSFQIVSNVYGYSVFTSHQITENLKFYLWIYEGFFHSKVDKFILTCGIEMGLLPFQSKFQFSYLFELENNEKYFMVVGW